MVNPGHPSKGCITCKKRRIKCDERRPTCEKCARSKRVCLGYVAEKWYDPECYGNAQSVDSEVLQELATLQTRGRHTKLAARISRNGTLSRSCRSISCAIPVPNRQFLPFTGSVQRPMSTTYAHSSTEAVISTAFQSLLSPVHTIQTHRNLQKRYQRAIHDLATTLSNSPPENSCISAYLFALYEVQLLCSP
jgi:hypothetical protein